MRLLPSQALAAGALLDCRGIPGCAFGFALLFMFPELTGAPGRLVNDQPLTRLKTNLPPMIARMIPKTTKTTKSTLVVVSRLFLRGFGARVID